MKIAALLTTWDRPRLLEQTLWGMRAPDLASEDLARTSTGLLAELDRLGIPLVVADDWSSDQGTLEILRRLEVDHGAMVLRNPTGRLQNVHAAIGRNALFGFRAALELAPDADFVLKVDDDLAVAHGAISRVFDAYTSAVDAGEPVFFATGLRTRGLEYLESGVGTWPWATISGGSAAFALFPAGDVRSLLGGYHEQELLRLGWDSYFVNVWRANQCPERDRFAVPRPSVVYHCGHRGAHSVGDLNVDWSDELVRDAGLYTEE